MDRKFGDVTVTSREAVGLVVFSRPPHNFFDVTLIRDIASAMSAVDEDPALRAVVLASEGKAFCAGASFSGAEGGTADPSVLYREAMSLFRFNKPIVGAIQGAAIGGGMGLALVPDFRIVSPEARFAANFVRIGIHPGFGLTHTLPRLIGEQAAALLFLSGRRIGGEEAVRIGLADVLTSADTLLAEALKLAAEIAENAPLALVSTRATLRAGLADRIAAQAERESGEQVALFATDDFREGVKAVAERRLGRWTGK